MNVCELYNNYKESDITGGSLVSKLTSEAFDKGDDKGELITRMITSLDIPDTSFHKPDMNAVDYLTKEDIMAMLHIKSDKALKLMKSEMLASVKLGNQYLTRKSWLDDFFETYKNSTVEL